MCSKSVGLGLTAVFLGMVFLGAALPALAAPLEDPMEYKGKVMVAGADL